MNDTIQGECGISDAHCLCSGCADSRQSIGKVKMLSWHADLWKNACGLVRTRTADDGTHVTSITEYCPTCQIGHFVVHASDTENIEVTEHTTDLDNSQWGMCFMSWPAGESGNLHAPRSVWRIDVFSTEKSKAPLVRWPCTTYGTLQKTGATVATRSDIARWPRLMFSARPDHFGVVHALDIGANVGGSSLCIGLFTSGRTIAIEMIPDNFQVLEFFAGMNPSLGIDAVLTAVAPADGKAQVSENGGRGKVVKFGSGIGIPAVEPMSFLEQRYGKEFVPKIGFVNLAVEGSEATILRALLPLVRRSLPAIQVEWNDAHRTQCGPNDSFSEGTHELLSVVEAMGYVAHSPDTGLGIDFDSRCHDFLYGPANLLLVPAVSLQKLGDLEARWRRNPPDAM